ncbi:MAG: thiol:disulfide interchange protein DsbA/DsbL [Deltaproteobacteria bacterium]|jgi:thiol:disulfide interchange protein DsbA|nr:thiol:disulfide interchange protein DsbA/DsbL [Deltaproteobacteria bacterium]
MSKLLQLRWGGATIIALVATLIFALSAWSWAQDKPAAAPDKPNPPYRGIKEIKNPQRWDNSDQKVEVLYFFWYGCGTCKDVDGQVNAMASRLPEGVRFKKVAAAFRENPDWSEHAKLFWALDNMGLEPKLRQAVFNAVQPSREVPTQLLSVNSQKAFARANHLNLVEFEQRLNEPLTRNMVEKTYAYLDAVDLGSVPSFVVNGRYVVSIEGRRPPTDFTGAAEKLALEELAKGAGEKKPAPAK